MFAAERQNLFRQRSQTQPVSPTIEDKTKDIASEVVKEEKEVARSTPAEKMPEAPQAAVSMGAEEQAFRNLLFPGEVPAITDLSTIAVPPVYGEVRDVYKGKDLDKIVIHIQEAHVNYEALLNIARIIESLINNYGVKLILSEAEKPGESGYLALRKRARLTVREKVADRLLREGKIKSGNYLALATDYDIDVEGVEDQALYRKSLQAFMNIQKSLQDTQKPLTSLKETVKALIPKLYPKEVLDLEKAKAEYAENKTSFTKYMLTLADLAQKKNVSMEKYPDIEKLVEAGKLEGNIDFTGVDKERRDVLDALNKKATPEKSRELLQKGLDFRRGKIKQSEYYAYLLSEKAQNDDAKALATPNMERYAEYTKYFDEINNDVLFQEADAFEDAVKQAYFTDDAQRMLNQISKGLEIMEKFFNIRLSPEDLVFYQTHKGIFDTGTWYTFLNDQATAQNLSVRPLEAARGLSGYLVTSEEFYTTAFARDVKMVDNTLALLDEKLPKDKQKIAVLIAGGFHTPKITELLRQKGISYVVITPRVTTPVDIEQYHKALLRTWDKVK